jgi:hypothetical protein
MGRQDAPQCTSRHVQLGLRVAQGTVKDGGNLVMLKAMDIVKEEGAPITGRQTGSRAIDGQTVNDPDLHSIMSADSPPYVFFGEVCHQVIE